MTRTLACAAALIGSLLLLGCIAGAPPAPSSAEATPIAGGILVSWSPVSGVSGYNVYRSAAEAEEGARINPSPITGATSFDDMAVSDGVTYYYTIRPVDSSGNELGSAKANATADTSPPRSLAIAIDGGANYTSQATVTLSLSASGASQCRYSNDGATWSEWEAYATQRQWLLPSGEGQKAVFYTCRDAVGNAAAPVSASIFLAVNPPVVSVTRPREGAQYSGSFDVAFTATSTFAQTLSCTGSIDGSSLQIGTVQSGVQATVPAQAGPGARTLQITCSDGYVSTSRTVQFTVSDKPTVSLSLGDGSGYTNTYSIVASINATMAASCRLSNDGINWPGWSSYSQQVQWQLSSGVGQKTVYAQCMGQNGTISDTVSDSITVDTRPPPFISILVNDGASITNSRSVTLTLYAFAASQCRYSNDGSTWSAWEAYTPSRAWTLTDGNGQKTVYYTCNKRNGVSAGNAQATIQYTYAPQSAPTNMVITINGGNTSTMSRTVQLSLSATYANQCRFSEDNDVWTSWEPYSTSRSYTFASGTYGTKTVYYQCRNDFGNQRTYSTIELEPSSPPTGLSIIINGGASYTTSQTVTLGLYAERANECRFLEVGHGWSGWESYSTSRSFLLSSGDGSKTVRYECRNSVGTASDDAYITLDQNPPSTITDLSATSHIANIALNWSPATDSGTGVQGYRVYRSNTALGLFTLIATVTENYYVDRDVAAGNEYAYYVRAFDGAGHTSANSNTVTGELLLLE
jgi:hypothetical protein